MFKNLSLYRLPAMPNLTAENLAAVLAPHAFVPCGPSELTRQGWVPPRGGDTPLVHAVDRQLLFALCVETRLLPAKVINRAAKARAAEIEEQQGFAPGKKMMKEIRERVADELLPRAFPQAAVTNVWLDPVNGWLAVDTASAARSDDVVKMLLKAYDRFPLESLRVQRSPAACMTEWLEEDEAPAGFTIDQDATLRATGESKAQVSYKRHTLEADDLRRHIAAGKQCSRLALTWDDKISFVLTESLGICRIVPLDVIKESANVADAEERHDSDFALMTGEFNALLRDLIAALGGEAKA